MEFTLLFFTGILLWIQVVSCVKSLHVSEITGIIAMMCKYLEERLTLQ
jgi:hypothetical protein